METLTNKVSQQITVRVLKYDGIEYRCWHARLMRQEDPLLVLDAEFEYDVQHQALGEIKRGTRTVEYYWLDRCYNVFRFLNAEGETRLFYCNINTPPAFADNTLSYVDLDIDVLVRPDFSYQVLDLEEFAENAARFGYPEKLKMHARAAVAELISMIASHRFPFDEKSLKSSVFSG